MLRDPSDRRACGRRLALAFIAAMGLSGCGEEAPKTGPATPTKEALKRQNEMFNFMKEQGKKPKAPAIPQKVG